MLGFSSDAISRMKRQSRLLTTYVIGQGGAQFLQLVTGFIVIRWLSKEAYADYTIINAILGMGSMLFGLGISQCLTGLIGKNITDSVLVGRFVYAAYSLRNRVMVVGIVLLMITFVALSKKFEWSFWVALFYFLCVSLTLFFNAWETVNKPVLLLEYRLREIYTLSCGACFARLLFLFVAALAGVLITPVVVFFNMLQAAINAVGMGIFSRSRITPVPKGECLSRERREILRLTLPKLPNLIVITFSSQLIFILAGIFATTTTLAEAGALSRLAMFFVIFKRMGGTLITPYFAKTERQDLLKRVVVLIVSLIGFVCLAGSLGYFFPDPLLFLLGPGYEDLQFETFLVVLDAAISVAVGALISVCNARKYVYSWHSLVVLPPRILMLVLGVIYLDLGNLTQLLMLGLSIAITQVITQFGILVYGICQTRKEARSEL